MPAAARASRIILAMAMSLALPGSAAHGAHSPRGADLPATPFDAVIVARCKEDRIDDYKIARGRNAWAEKCNLITTEEQESYDMKRFYVVFLEGDAPHRADAPCESYAGWESLGPCPLGCFAATETLWFGGNEMTIPDAARLRQRTVTGLGSDAKLGDLTLEEHPIGRFTYGPTNLPLVRITDTETQTIDVTAEHPMFTCAGDVVDAGSLRTGDEVLAVDGCRTLASVTLRAASATDEPTVVWNVEPFSQDLIQNTTVASGFVTGSLRFQNEWADDYHRLAVRRRFAERHASGDE